MSGELAVRGARPMLTAAILDDEADQREETQDAHGLLEARGTYTPASAETFSVTLEFWKRVP